MLKQRVLFVSGIAVALIYFLGFPNFIRAVILVVLGLLICLCAVLNFYERKYLDQKIKRLEKGQISDQETIEEIIINTTQNESL